METRHTRARSAFSIQRYAKVVTYIMFRITFVFLMILTLLVGCNQPVIGSIDSDNIRGNKAKKQILAAVNSADLLYAGSIITPGISTAAVTVIVTSFNSLLIPIVAKLDDKKYYLKDSVKTCTTKIYALRLILPSYATVALSCDIKEAPFFSIP